MFRQKFKSPNTDAKLQTGAVDLLLFFLPINNLRKLRNKLDKLLACKYKQFVLSVERISF